MSISMRGQWLAAVIAFAACMAAVLAATGQSAPVAGAPSHAQAAASAAGAGERVFMANCARCHTPPMTLSPRVTGAVVAHMRVRARLSLKDEQLLLKYLAP